jgi:hypothetical protein
MCDGAGEGTFCSRAYELPVLEANHVFLDGQATSWGIITENKRREL